MSEELVDVKVVCAGEVLLADQTLGTVLRQVFDDGSLGPERVFKKVKGMWPGAAYRMRATPDLERLTTQNRTYQGNYADEGADARGLVAGWEARTYAAGLKRRNALDEKRGAQWDPLVALLEPVRKEWQKADRLGRAAIELRMLDALRWGYNR